jgi:hypothetical protein
MTYTFKESQDRVQSAREFMFQNRHEYSYPYNNVHGTTTEKCVSENYGINWMNPNTRAPIDFPKDKIMESTLPSFVKDHEGHGLEQKAINDKKLSNVKLGDAGINADMLESGGYILGGFIFSDQPENVHTIQFWRLEAEKRDILAMEFSKEIRAYMKDQSNSIADIRARVREMNIALRNCNSRFSLTDCSTTASNKRCVQLILKTGSGYFDW